jgi:hypothetical protein
VDLRDGVIGPAGRTPAHTPRSAYAQHLAGSASNGYVTTDQAVGGGHGANGFAGGINGINGVNGAGHGVNGAGHGVNGAGHGDDGSDHGADGVGNALRPRGRRSAPPRPGE